MLDKNSGVIPDLSGLKRIRSFMRSVIFLLAGIMPVAIAQAPPAPAPGAPTAPAFSGADKAFAAELAAQPVDDALKAVAAADISRLTPGLCRALKQAGDQAGAANPQRAVEIFRVSEAAATRAGLPIVAADAHFNQGFYMVAAGDLDGALPAYNRALEMYKAANAPPAKLAVVYINLAVADLRLGDLQAAIAADKNALQIYTQAGDEVGVARAQNGLGNAFREQSSFTEAEAAYTEALRIARASGEKMGESFVLNNLSILHATEGDYPMAMQFCEQSLALKRQYGSKASVVTTLLNLSNFYDVLDRDTDAMRVLDEAAQIARDLNMKEAIAKTTAEMGIIQLKLHHTDAALKLLLESSAPGSASEDQEGLAFTLVKIAEAYVDQGNYDKALAYSQQAAGIDRRAGMTSQLSNADLVLGQTYLSMHKLDEARKVLEESVSAIEQMRDKVTGGAAERRLFMAERSDPYRLLAIIAAMQGNLKGALDNSEKGKGRILLDLYTGNELDASNSLTDAERDQENALRTRFRSLDMQIDRQASAPGFDPSQKNALDEKLQQARAKLADYRGQLYLRHPELRVRRADFTALTPQQLQALIPARTSALLEFELSEISNYLFVITRGAGDTAEIHSYKLKPTSTELAQHVHRFQQQLADRDPEFATESRWLDSALLEPASSQLRNITSLVVVPDGVLWKVPFQALQQTDGTFLVEHAAVDYVPSLAVLRALKASSSKPHSAHTLLAMGNPGNDTEEQANEALALGKLYGSMNSRILIGNQATVGQFQAIAPTYEVVHIAAHGIFDDHEPMSSHMIMASAGSNPHAGWLRAREIQSTQLKADLMVLSGCETGKGSFEDGEGLVGMSWATLAAGAHGSLASAWRVEAASTTEMMLAFHQNLQRGVGKAEALRRAELKILHSDKYAHPFYWAAFVFMGDGTS